MLNVKYSRPRFKRLQGIKIKNDWFVSNENNLFKYLNGKVFTDANIDKFTDKIELAVKVANQKTIELQSQEKKIEKLPAEIYTRQIPLSN